MHSKQYPPLLTNTWIFIGFSNKVKHGTKKPIRLMGRDLILWRTTSGKLSLLDAYCSHMGAHLDAGTIRGELLECAFHKRCFDTEGKCQGKGKGNFSYPLTIINNLIFAWFGAGQPAWQMPDFLHGFPHQPESKWKIFRNKTINLNFHPQDLLDNTVDPVHYKTFHNQCISFKPAEVLERTPFSFISKVTFLEQPQLKKLGIPLELELVTESYGPCNLLVNGIVNVKQQTYYFKFIFYCAPVDNGNTNFTLITSVLAENKSPFMQRIFGYLYAHYAFYKQFSEFFKESKTIWERKTFLSQINSTPSENIMSQYHEWYSQFYLVHANSG